jgi:hypothetical protein
MVVEHAFITTLEAPDALRLASQFLSERGFEARAQEAFAIGSGGNHWNVLEMSRGKKNPRRAKSVLEYPQTLRLEWDRGRVTVAVSSTSYQESRSDYFGRHKGKIAQWQQEGLMAIVTHLQQLLEGRATEADTVASLAAQENDLHARDRRRRARNMWITVVVLVLAFGGLIALIAVLANVR